MRDMGAGIVDAPSTTTPAAVAVANAKLAAFLCIFRSLLELGWPVLLQRLVKAKPTRVEADVLTSSRHVFWILTRKYDNGRFNVK